MVVLSRFKEYSLDIFSDEYIEKHLIELLNERKDDDTLNLTDEQLFEFLAYTNSNIGITFDKILLYFLLLTVKEFENFSFKKAILYHGFLNLHANNLFGEKINDNDFLDERLEIIEDAEIIGDDYKLSVDDICIYLLLKDKESQNLTDLQKELYKKLKKIWEGSNGVVKKEGNKFCGRIFRVLNGVKK